MNYNVLTWYSEAASKWITSESFVATANRAVVDYFTACIYTTCSWTWIHTFEVNTCSVLGTFRAHNTFWSTTWRAANVIRQAWAYALSINCSALTVWPTWWRNARISRYNDSCINKGQETYNVRGIKTCVCFMIICYKLIKISGLILSRFTPSWLHWHIYV